MQQYVYLIDGVRVSRKIFERRKIWGEHAGARFEVIVPRIAAGAR